MLVYGGCFNISHGVVGTDQFNNVVKSFFHKLDTTFSLQVPFDCLSLSKSLCILLRDTKGYTTGCYSIILRVYRILGKGLILRDTTCGPQNIPLCTYSVFF